MLRVLLLVRVNIRSDSVFHVMPKRAMSRTGEKIYSFFQINLRLDLKKNNHILDGTAVGAIPTAYCFIESFKSNAYFNSYIPPDHLLFDIDPNLGPLISRWEINKFKNC
jgi:hypothetical protein